MRKRGDSLSAIKSIFTKNYEIVDDNSEIDKLKREYVVKGYSTKRTLTLQINSDHIKVYVHEESGIVLGESVAFTNIKSVSVPTKNMVAVDWIHGPFQTQDVSKFYTSEGEAKQIRDKFYQENFSEIHRKQDEQLRNLGK